MLGAAFGGVLGGVLGGGLAALALPGRPARAEAPDPTADWTVVPEASAIGFGYSLNGKAAEGRFTGVAGGGRFDPDDPASAVLEIRIAADSIDLGNPLFSAFATSAEWFDARNHPEMRYRLSRLEPVEGDLYRAHGDVSIRGRTTPLVSEIRLETGADEARASGVLTLDRTDYLLGVGPSSLIVDVGREVTVSFELTAVRS